VLAECAQRKLGARGQLDRVAERFGQLLDPEPPALLR
jgi:hypothetical protein